MADADGSSLRGLIRRTSDMFARRRIVLASTLGGLLLADVLVALSVSADYRSTAAIAVEARPETAGPAGLRLGVEQLVSTTNDPTFLSELAQSHHLTRPRTPFDIVSGEPASPIERLRRRLSVDITGQPGERRLIEITSTGDDPHGVADIASRVASRLLAREASDRIGTAKALLASAEKQASQALTSASSAEEALDRFRRANPQVTTEPDEALRARATDVESKVLADDALVAELEGEIPFLESEEKLRRQQVSDEAALAQRAALAKAAAKAREEKEKAQQAEAEGGRAPKAAAAHDPRRTRVAELEEQLRIASASKTEQHPDVRRLRAELDELRLALAPSVANQPGANTPGPLGTPSAEPAIPGREIDPRTPPEAAPRGSPFEAPRDPSRGEGSGEAPAGDRDRRFGGRHEGVTDVRPASDERSGSESAQFLFEAPSYAGWREISGKLEASRRKLAAAKPRLARELAERDRLKSQLERLPELRAELARLASAREKLVLSNDAAQAQLAALRRACELDSSSARLVLVQGASLPDAPFGPDRTKLFLIGLAMALPFALLAAYFREVHDRSFHEVADAAASLGLPVLGTIPRLQGQRTWGRRT